MPLRFRPLTVSVSRTPQANDGPNDVGQWFHMEASSQISDLPAKHWHAEPMLKGWAPPLRHPLYKPGQPFDCSSWGWHLLVPRFLLQPVPWTPRPPGVGISVPKRNKYQHLGKQTWSYMIFPDLPCLEQPKTHLLYTWTHFGIRNGDPIHWSLSSPAQSSDPYTLDKSLLLWTPFCCKFPPSNQHNPQIIVATMQVITLGNCGT